MPRELFDLNVRASYALFEISDRSNRDSIYAFKDTKFIVNVVESEAKQLLVLYHYYLQMRPEMR